MDDDMTYINDLVKAKIAENYLTALIDTILDNSQYNKYTRYGMRIDDEAAIYALVKAIAPDEYNNRLNELKEEDKRIRAELEKKAKEED